MTDKKPSRFDDLFGAARAKSTESESENLDVQASKSLSTQTSKNLDIQTSKSKDPTYQRTTIYLAKALHRKLKTAAIDDGREMSEIVEELITQWLESRNKKHSDV